VPVLLGVVLVALEVPDCWVDLGPPVAAQVVQAVVKVALMEELEARLAG
jgi:hypothetical protein